jgi:hypothetical protein
MGRPVDAVTKTEARLAEEPTNTVYRHDLGLALAAAGEYANARPILEEMWQPAEGTCERFAAEGGN